MADSNWRRLVGLAIVLVGTVAPVAAYAPHRQGALQPDAAQYPAQQHSALTASLTRAVSASAAAVNGIADTAIKNGIIVIAAVTIGLAIGAGAFLFLIYKSGLGSVFSTATGAPDVRKHVPPDVMAASGLNGVKEVGVDDGSGGGGDGGAKPRSKWTSWVPRMGKR